MRLITPELSRPLEVDRVPALGSHETVEASPDELVAIAKRLDLPAIHALSARLHAQPWRGGLKLRGRLKADIDQLSVVSLEKFRSTVEFEVERYFMAEHGAPADADEEVDPIENGKIDLGEVVVETLALQLDPYPRQPGETFNPGERTGNTQDSNPFELLKQLKS